MFFCRCITCVHVYVIVHVHICQGMLVTHDLAGWFAEKIQVQTQS